MRNFPLFSVTLIFCLFGILASAPAYAARGCEYHIEVADEFGHYPFKLVRTATGKTPIGGWCTSLKECDARLARWCGGGARAALPVALAPISDDPVNEAQYEDAPGPDER